MNDGHKALLARLREIVIETPRSGALNAGRKPLYIHRFAQAVENRAQDGGALVAYTRAKIHEAPTTSYGALIEAGRPDLTVEAVVADTDAAWASEFTDADRQAARDRLGDMAEAHRVAQEALAAELLAQDRRIVDRVSASRVGKGMPALTPEQERQMLDGMAAKRAPA